MSKECNHVFVDEDGSEVEQVKVKKGCSKLLAIQCIQDCEIVLAHFSSCHLFCSLKLVSLLCLRKVRW